MTNRQINSRLERILDVIEELKEDLESEIEDIDERQEQIEDKACDADRDMTEKEQERFYALEDQKNQILYIIQNLDIDMDDFYLEE